MKCLLCKKSDYAEWGRVGAYSILICKECGLGVTDPFPTENEITETNQVIYQVEQRIKTYLSRRKYFEKRYRDVIADMKRFKSEGKLLDVGCNIGLFLHVAREEGFSVIGVEPNTGCAGFGIKNFKLDIRSERLEDVALAEGSMNVVTMFDVLEHIPDIHGLLSEVRRVLARDGLLVIQSPNIQSLMARWTRSSWSWLTPPDHVYHFAPATLESLLQEHGFETKLLKTWEPAGEFSNNLLAMLIKKTPAVGKALFWLNRITNIGTLAVLITQKLWWRKQMGGLIEVFAVKVEA